jgi:glycosyltransferase involved in cell wall biosynthesis
MRISVALATCDSERYLEELLESLLRQSAPPHELVVWDDASTDSTPAILERFAASAPFPVRRLGGEARAGHVEAFMRAARECSGDAVAFCDHDDVWEPRKLEACGLELERTGATLVMHTTRLVDREGRDLGRDWPPIARSALVPPLGLAGLDVDTPGLAMAFRREVLGAADFDSRPPSRYGQERMLHDEWVAFVGGAIGSAALIAEPLVRYRQHGANQSGWVERRRGSSLRPAVEDYERAARHTAACAEYLARGERTAWAAGTYRRAAANWELRASLYRAPGRVARAAMLARLAAGRAYGPRAAGGFGRAALGKDVVAGLVLKHR